MRAKRPKFFIVQALAVLAYLACALLWMVALLPFVPSLVASDAYRTYVVSDTPPEPSIQQTDISPAMQGVMFVGAVVLTLAIMSIVTVSLRRAPKVVGQTGQRMTRGTAELVVPALTHHRHVPPQQKKRLTARTTWYLKIGLIVIPLVVAAWAPLASTLGLTRELLMVTAGSIAAWALLLFGVQLMLGKIWHIPAERIW